MTCRKRADLSAKVHPQRGRSWEGALSLRPLSQVTVRPMDHVHSLAHRLIHHKWMLPQPRYPHQFLHQIYHFKGNKKCDSY